MSNDPAWDHYRSFLAVADKGSLSAAARALGLTQPTLGRHIEALEASLGGAALFTRSPAGLRPTETALALRPHAEAMAMAAEALMRTASGETDAARGVVRVTASEIVGAEVLPAILTDFREAQPDIDVELVLSNQQQDLLRRDADIAVRMARPTQDALFARKLGEVRLYFHAHRRYLERHGEPRDMDDLAANHTLIGFDRISPSIGNLDTSGIAITRDIFSLRTDSDLAQLACLRAGYGISPCQLALARDHELIPILKDKFHFDLEVWVAMHEDLKAVKRMRLMFEALAEGLKAYVAEARERA